MDFSNKYLLASIRIVFGILIALSGISGYFVLQDYSNLPANQLAVMTVLVDTGLFHLVKIVEIIIGLMLIFNFLPALAAIILAPISINILVMNAMITPTMLPIAIVVALVNAYFGCAYWDKYKELFKR